ncbi:MAG: FHA domain-containing protein, partial [Muribaculaceae bacterium]|nr:FHA domain-containing protein [Muribaculaceae bacterium]
MANKTTQPYRKTLSGSIGAGMGSLFSPGGKKYYILEHKVSSKYHKAGESQEIIVDNIELGRDSHCQVRFDESFKTVSRRHAAIVKDGDMWKLVPLSKTNTTFLNGRPVKEEWYLQNGDEIQLSVNGPKMGFITPTGKKSTVGSIGLTRRLSLFRQQALRPYKTAIACLSVVLVLAVGGLGTWSYLKGQEYENLIASAQKRLDSLKSKNAELEQLIADAAKEQHRLDSLLKIKQRPVHKTVVINRGGSTGGGGNNGGGGDNVSNLQKHEDDIFKIMTAMFVEYQGQRIPLETVNGGLLGWSGTGYLLSDGRFVTAKHCVEGWKFNSVEDLNKQLAMLKDESLKTLFIAGLTRSEGVKLGALIVAKSPTKELKFYSNQFIMDHSDETMAELDGNLNIIVGSLRSGGDWAYAKTGNNGSIIGDASLSANLPAGARLEV